MRRSIYFSWRIRSLTPRILDFIYESALGYSVLLVALMLLSRVREFKLSIELCFCRFNLLFAYLQTALFCISKSQLLFLLFFNELFLIWPILSLGFLIIFFCIDLRFPFYTDVVIWGVFVKKYCLSISSIDLKWLGPKSFWSFAFRR